MSLSVTRNRICCFVAVHVWALASSGIAVAQRPSVRPHFEGYSFDNILIAMNGRGAWHVPEYGGTGDGPWLVNGTWGSDRILVYDATPLQVSALTGNIFRGTSKFLNSSRMLVAEFQDSGGKTIQVEWISKNKLTYVVIDTHDGDDYVEVTSYFDCWIELGKGYDIAMGGRGNDYIENTNNSGEIYAGHIDGGQGADTLVGNVTGKGLFGSQTNLDGGPGLDTFIFNKSDRIFDTIDGESGVWVGDGFEIPNLDFTYNGGRYAGMMQITLDN